MSFFYCVTFYKRYIDSMTIENKSFTVIQNQHLENSDMLLHKLLKQANMSQAEFAKKVKKDASTVNRWIKNNRSIAWENAEKIAKVLGCHPVDIYKPQHKIIIDTSCDWSGFVTNIQINDQTEIILPYEYYHENLKAVMMNQPGTPYDGEIWLFDIPKVKKFSKYSIGKLCYLTPSKKLEKNPDCRPVIGLLKAKGNGRLSIVNVYTDKPLNNLCADLSVDDLNIATPVKAKYDPDLVNFHVHS